MRTLVATSCAAGAFLATCANVGSAQTFRTGVQLVHVDVVVVDRAGNPIRNLQQADFDLFEDGKAVEVAFLRAVEAADASGVSSLVPLARGDVGLVSNVNVMDGRVLVLVFDDLHVRFSSRSANWARQMAHQIIDRLGPSDQLAVVATSGRAALQTDFTSDKALLKEVVDRFRPRLDSRRGSPIGADAFSEAWWAFSGLERLLPLAKSLSAINDRRKAIVMISNGIPYDLVDSGPWGSSWLPALRGLFHEFADAAKRANVPIYTLDPQEMQPSRTPGQRNLEWLSEQTGGFASVNTNVFERSITRLIAESGTHYVLGYYSSAPQDGRFHRIDVKVRRPGMTVRARQGFVATKPATPATVREALDATVAAPLPLRGLWLRLAAVPLPRAGEPGAAIAVAIELGGDKLIPGATIDFVAMAIDMQGRIASEERFSLRTRSEAASSRRWARVASRLELKPGRHVLRVAARQAEDGAAGSVFTEIEVPRYDQQLAVGGLSLGTVNTTHVARAGRIADVLPVVPLAAHVFSRDDAVVAALKVRVGRRHSGRTVRFTAMLEGPEKDVRPIDRGERPADAFATGDGASYTLELPLEGLAAGDYTLMLEVALPDGRRQTRSATFSVVDAPTVQRANDRPKDDSR